MAALAMSIAKSEFIVGGKYRLMRKIGSGSFGDIYLGINISNGEVRRLPRASHSPDLHDLLLDCLTSQPASSVPSARVSRSSRSGARSSLSTRSGRTRRDGTAVCETAP